MTMQTVAPWPLTVEPCVKCGKPNWDLAGKPLPESACPSCLRDYNKVMAAAEVGGVRR